MQIDIGGSSSFFVVIFLHFGKNMFPHKFPAFLKNLRQKTKNIPQKHQNFVTIAYNMKGCLRFSTSKFG
jgi:hypothetical protein